MHWRRRRRRYCSFPMNCFAMEICLHILKPPPHTQLGDYIPYASRNQESFSEDAIMSLSALQKKKWNEKLGWRDEYQISTCPHCHLALPVKTLLWHKVRMSCTSQHSSMQTIYRILLNWKD